MKIVGKFLIAIALLGNTAADQTIPQQGPNTVERSEATYCLPRESWESATSVGLQENLAKIKLPRGFKMDLYAEVLCPRQLALGDNGTVFVGSGTKNVYAIVDENDDDVADRIHIVARDLKIPTGVEFRHGSLYVGDLDRILRYDEVESMLGQPLPPKLVTSKLPDEPFHGQRYLRFGPDNLLYFVVGAPCDICDEPGFGQIRRITADGNGEEAYAFGVRNSVGLAFHPATGQLWFTDNGADALGRNTPSDELNVATKSEQTFGFPYCHQGDLLDAAFGTGKACADYTPPAVKLGAHVAPLGLAFNNGRMFPKEYQGSLFIAEHSSANGCNLAVVRFGSDENPLSKEVFASGWRLGQDACWGKPVDILQLPDGSLLVSDDWANAIYRISYTGS
jgi:glucose/arabinose dehydrogenase